MHPVEDTLLIITAEIQVLQPYEIALVLGALDDLDHVRDAGEDRYGPANSGLRLQRTRTPP